ncbi:MULTISPECIES: hypothetical protein [unclassified Lentimicrobium]|uniref:alpha/beta hydrolase n=1 Tax=unclassified Lentimicrobium TaxID=2677434 RepID=UPI00155824F3|nr:MULTISPECIES: hypothetical protein [unclassified Lentimicrobium]NPD46038.1 hypothetical protein [Lentimicrobium sp. S6]NPD85238.1 hypothetical protein [Lentimicrobium sp. L6]
MRLKYYFSLLLIFYTISLIAQQDTSFLPMPSGPYQVGTTEWFITDSSRQDPFKKRDKRRLYIKIWYPAQIKSTEKPELYLESYPTDLIYNAFKIKKFSKEWIASIQEYPTHSYPEAELIAQKNGFPVILFNPGFYFGMADLYTGMMEALASQGYIVCSINHPYEQPYIKFPDGEEIYLKKKRAQWSYMQLVFANWFQWKKKDSPEKNIEITRYYHKMLRRFKKIVNFWVEDTRFFIDYLEEEQDRQVEHALLQAMDLNAIGAFGQSVGGSVIGELCVQDDRVKAGINLDCFQFGNAIDQPLKQPFMLIESDYNADWNLGNTVNFSHTDGDFAFLRFPKSSHFVFSDGAVLPYPDRDNEVRMIGDIDGALVFNSLNLYISEFFNQYLKFQHSSVIQSNMSNLYLDYFLRKAPLKIEKE